jgi:hypothetical protein
MKSMSNLIKNKIQIIFMDKKIIVIGSNNFLEELDSPKFRGVE